MQAKDVLEAKGYAVITVDPDRSVPEVAEILMSHHIGAAVVSRDGRTMDGIISERDIARGVHQYGAAVTTKQVRDLMTSEVVCCRPDHEVGEIMALMTNNGIRHVPVVEQTQVVGMVSIRDVVDHRIAALNDENKALKKLLTDLA